MELVLTRSSDDRRRYDLDGVGSVRRNGLLGRSSELRTVAGRVLQARPVGLLGRGAEAVDEASGVVGRFSQQGMLRHGGEVVWNGLPHRIASVSSWKNRYEVSRNEVTLLTIEARGWGRTPARVELQAAGVDPGLVLFAIWLVQQFIEQNAAAGG